MRPLMPIEIHELNKNNVKPNNKRAPYKMFSQKRCFVLLLLSTVSLPVTAGWEVQWIDKFDDTGVNWNNWTAQTQANYNNEVQCYTNDEVTSNKNYEVSDGTLKIIARRQSINCPGLAGAQKSWTSGRLNSKDKQEFLYGRVESRIRFHNLKAGTWPAFWMLENRIAEQPIKNDNDFIPWPNPGAGEIDVWEWFSNAPETYITNFFNTNSCGNEVRYAYPGGAEDVLQWHQYAIEWNENNIAFFIDDIQVTSQDISDCPQYKEPMFVLINVAMGGNLGGSIASDLNLATMEIDYVAHCSATNTNNLNECNESTPRISDDEDGDGVEDAMDLCPETPIGDTIDENGCTIQEETNTAPIVSLVASQNGQNNTDISPNNGVVTLTAIVDDANQNDSFDIEWITQNLPNTTKEGFNISFDPSSMADGSYQISVTVSDDGDPVLSDNASIVLSVKTADVSDLNSQSGGGGSLLLILFSLFWVSSKK